MHFSRKNGGFRVFGYDRCEVKPLIRKAEPTDAEVLLENLNRLSQEPMRNIVMQSVEVNGR
jgi:hypothetical protein